MQLSSSRIIGHRGVPSLAPENTLGGFRRAAELGVQWVELDVMLMADGTPVVHHDDTLDRCSDRRGVLAQMRYDELDGINNSARYPGWPPEPVPRLDQVLALLELRGMGLNLELKTHPGPPETLVQPVIDCLGRHFPRHSERPPALILSSFSLLLIECCLRLAPNMPRALVFDVWPEDWLAQARRVQAYSIHCNWRTLTQQRVEAIKAAGFKLYCWTLNDARRADRLWRWGVDGVMTDYPQRFIAHQT